MLKIKYLKFKGIMKKENKAIVLLHGFLNNSIVMYYLQFKMRSQGYKVYLFEYNTRNYSEETLIQFDKLIESIPEKGIYVVGHSMGGLVTRNYLNSNPNKKNHIKAVITIATPHNQSIFAHNIDKILKGILGTAGDSGLTKDIIPWNNKIPLGCIAGRYENKLKEGLLFIMNGKKGNNDGTVFLEEAILEGCKDSIIVEGSHTGLLFKRSVALQCMYFIEHLKFKK